VARRASEEGTGAESLVKTEPLVKTLGREGMVARLTRRYGGGMSSEPAVGPSEETARRVSRFWPLISGITAVVLVIGGGLLIVTRAAVPEIDTEWMAEIEDHRSPVWLISAMTMNFLGGGWFALYVVPAIVVVAFCLAGRFWTAGYFAIASAASVGLVQLLKHLFDRVRPPDGLVQIDTGSFPSGHVANAATMAVVLGIIFWKTWVWVVGVLYTMLMMLSRTYLGVHWLTDTLGGLLMGAAVAVMVWAPLANRVKNEWQPQRRSNVHP
jgi:membrane-associated phospholipid phosphatase